MHAATLLRWSSRSAALVSALALAACATPSNIDAARSVLNAPVNCATARADIATLQQGRASTEEEAMAGLQSVAPMTAIEGAATGTYGQTEKMATGQYNQAIDAKIAEIQATCRL